MGCQRQFDRLLQAEKSSPAGSVDRITGLGADLRGPEEKGQEQKDAMNERSGR
jgi:hypothetical protein